VKNLSGDVLSDSEVWHVYTIANGLIERMDLKESEKSSGSTHQQHFPDADMREDRPCCLSGDGMPAFPTPAPSAPLRAGSCKERKDGALKVLVWEGRSKPPKGSATAQPHPPKLQNGDCESGCGGEIKTWKGGPAPGNMD